MPEPAAMSRIEVLSYPAMENWCIAASSTASRPIGPFDFALGSAFGLGVFLCLDLLVAIGMGFFIAAMDGGVSGGGALGDAFEAAAGHTNAGALGIPGCRRDAFVSEVDFLDLHRFGAWQLGPVLDVARHHEVG